MTVESIYERDDDLTPDDLAEQYELMQWQRFNAQRREDEAAGQDTDESAATHHAMTGEDTAADAIRAAFKADADAAKSQTGRREVQQSAVQKKAQGPSL